MDTEIDESRVLPTPWGRGEQVKAKLAEHISSMAFVTLVLSLALVGGNASQSSAARGQIALLGGFHDLTVINVEQPFERALLGDVMDIFNPGTHDKNTQLVQRIVDHTSKSMAHRLQKSHIEERLSFSKLLQLSGMFLKFLFVYSAVMLLTYYGVETLGVWTYYRHQRLRGAQAAQKKWVEILKKAGGVVSSFILFCPAYVIAYSIRTELNSDTIPFMILLATVSNGLLILYANKFSAFLVAESRKGYVETARVKHLKETYEPASGFSLRAILNPAKRFPGHVFDHIFQNARLQYRPTVKEQASFLITGLIIIEMALNIHGQLNYEMLRQLLYRNYDIVIVIVLGMFYTVKMTEIVADWIAWRDSVRYANTSERARS